MPVSKPPLTLTYSILSALNRDASTLYEKSGLAPIEPQTGYSWANRRRSELVITDTELRLIAALAMIGLKRMPKNGYSTPAATGTPSTL